MNRLTAYMAYEADSPFGMVRTGLTAMSMMVVLGLSGCQSGWDTPPDHGQSVNDAVQAQLVNPSAPVGNAPAPRGMDGPAARYTIENYEKTFRDPRINRSSLGNVTGQVNPGASSTGGSSGPVTPR